MWCVQCMCVCSDYSLTKVISMLLLYLFCLIVFPSFALEKSLLFGMGSYRSRWEVTCTHRGKRDVTLYTHLHSLLLKLSTSKTINMNDFAELQLQQRSESSWPCVWSMLCLTKKIWCVPIILLFTGRRDAFDRVCVCVCVVLGERAH